MSDEVTEPKSRPPSPARASIVTSAGELGGDGFAPLRGRAGPWRRGCGASRRPASGCRAWRAAPSPCGTRKLRAKPSATSTRSPFLPRLLDVGAQHDLHHDVRLDFGGRRRPSRRVAVDAVDRLDQLVDLVVGDRPTLVDSSASASGVCNVARSTRRARRGRRGRRGRGGPSSAASPGARCTAAAPSHARA